MSNVVTKQMNLYRGFYFSFKKTFFKVYAQKFLSSFYMISLALKMPYCLSANHNPELQCVLVICTGVTCTFELHCSQPVRIKSFFCVSSLFLPPCYQVKSLLVGNLDARRSSLLFVKNVGQG